jgi:hypothetical protein
MASKRKAAMLNRVTETVIRSLKQVPEVPPPWPEEDVGGEDAGEEGGVDHHPGDQHPPEHQEAPQRFQPLLVVGDILSARCGLYELKIQKFVHVVLSQAGAGEAEGPPDIPDAYGSARSQDAQVDVPGLPVDLLRTQRLNPPSSGQLDPPDL